MDKQGTKQISLPGEWSQVAFHVMKYLTCEGKYSNLHSIHFKLLSHLRHGRRMNIPNVLYHLISISAKEIQKGSTHFVSHHGLIKLLVERSLRDVSHMSWGEFEDIRQFGEENVPAAEEIIVQEENIAEASFPRVYAAVEPLIAEEALSGTKGTVVEHPSTQTQSGATFYKRKGKEKGDARGETMEWPQEAQVPLAAKKRKMKEDFLVAEPPTTTQEFPLRRSHRVE